MAYAKILGSAVDTHDNQKNYRDTSDPGPYVAVVKDTQDPLRMGRLGVVIPALSHDGAETGKVKQDQIWWCQYLSPFYGAKPFASVSKTDPYSHKTNQTAYGMWAVPPDIDTNVLVIFAQGDKSQSNAFWIGCIQEPLTNQMVPGLGATSKSKLGVESVGEFNDANKQSEYGTDRLPVLEKNKNMYDPGEELTTAELWNYPINEDLAQQLREQGLVQDTVRGTTTSSARRETPSRVFGISTPGKIKSNTSTPNIGPDGAPVEVDRDIGHSFVMDDGDVNGTNQLTRLRTSSGHQLLMHDTHGVVYIANGTGKSWIEMSADGKIYIYAQDGLNFRSDGNFDLHSGGDINFHAKRSIKFHAENNVALSAEKYIQQMGELGIEQSSQSGTVRAYAKSGISSYTDASQRHGAGGRVDLAGSQVHFNSVGASSGWGPGYLKPDSQFVGIVIDDNTQNDVNLNVGVGNLLVANTAVTKTTVPNLVTHEPFTRAPSAIMENVSQWTNEKEWLRLSKIEGTLEWFAEKNRNAEIKYIRDLQFLHDQKKYLADLGAGGPPPGHPEYIANSTLKNMNLEKIKVLSDEFTKNYNEIYKVKTVFENLSKDNLKQIVVQKVVGGTLTSVASQIKGIALGRSSANNLPPSMRGTMLGQFTQVGAAIKEHWGTAVSAVTSFFGKWSDMRLKEDIQLIGKSPAGVNIYRFKYKHTDGTYQGVMAQEVPWARIMTDTGFYKVDYNKVDVEFRRLH